MAETKPRVPTKAALLRRLKAAADTARKSAAKAEGDMERRNVLVRDAHDAGATYAQIAEVLGITVDGVTYVLRRMRRR